jgi:hypothetical protein
MSAAILFFFLVPMDAFRISVLYSEALIIELSLAGEKNLRK